MTDPKLTPPPELVQEWLSSVPYDDETEHWAYEQHIASRAAAWGADQELEACCVEMKSLPSPLGIPFGEIASNALRAARRRKPPTLKKQALQALSEAVKMADDVPPEGICSDQADIIRRALEQLPDHE